MIVRTLGWGMSLALLVPGLALVGRQGYREAKGALARRLVDRALEDRLRDGGVHRPWSWADTWPLARLEVPRLDLRRAVLEGSNGTTLAFGLGHVESTAPPNGPGNCVVAGHRDGPARFLKHLRPGDRLRLATWGMEEEYLVDGVAVVHERESSVLAVGGSRRLTLVTCYPFDGWTASPWRYVVTCRPAASPPAP